MAAIVFCWELGAGQGHLVRLAPVIAACLDAGHEAALICADLVAARAVGIDPRCRLLPAPRALPDADAHTPRSYLDIVRLHSGVGAVAGGASEDADIATLDALLAGWGGLFELLKPDLIVLDFSPFAQLAAYANNIPAISIGTGFTVPPDSDYLPDFRRQKPAPALAFEAQDLCSLFNQVLVAQGGSPLGDMAAFLASPAVKIVAGPAWLDPYQQERDKRTLFLTPWAGIGTGLAPDWYGGESHAGSLRIFIYLDATPQSAAFMQIVQRYVQKRQRNGAVLPQILITGALAERLRRSGQALPDCIRLISGRLDMQQVMAVADIVVSHGGHGVCAALSCFGKKACGLFLPRVEEQLLNAKAMIDHRGDFAVPMMAMPEYEAVLEHQFLQAIAAQREAGCDAVSDMAARSGKSSLNMIMQLINELLTSAQDKRPFHHQHDIGREA